jgi:hypothetical protein
MLVNAIKKEKLLRIRRQRSLDEKVNVRLRCTLDIRCRTTEFRAFDHIVERVFEQIHGHLTGNPIAAAVVARMNGGYAESRLPLVTIMDMLLFAGTATGAPSGAS